MIEQCREILVFDLAHCTDASMGELEHERGRNNAIRRKKLENSGERARIGQRCPGKIAEQPDLLVLEQQASDNCNATEQHKIVDL